MATYDEILGNTSNAGNAKPTVPGKLADKPTNPIKLVDQTTIPDKLENPVRPDEHKPQVQQDHITDVGNMGYAALYKALNPYKPPTDEELAKEKKKQKRDQIFAAIGDGISALSNLFFTTQYAPNMYSGRNTASEKVQLRYDRLMKERQDNARAYMSGLFGAMQADEAKARDDRNWRHQLEREKRADGIADAKDKRDSKMFDLNVQLQNNKISAAEAEAKRKAVEAEYAEELEKAKVDTEKAKASASRASASASNARAGYYNSGGSSGNKKKMTLTIEGKTHYYDTEEDYERAVQREAKKLGIATHQVVQTTESNGRLSKTKNVSTPKPISQLAGEVEIASNKKKSPTAGVGGSNKKKSPTL